MSAQETITWHPVEQKLPDADTTVLIQTPEHDEPVWMGHYDGVFWFGVGGEEFEEGDVTAWAEMPAGAPKS